MAKAENDFFEILEQERKRREREQTKRQKGDLFNEDDEKRDEGKVSGYQGQVRSSYDMSVFTLAVMSDVPIKTFYLIW